MPNRRVAWILAVPVACIAACVVTGVELYRGFARYMAEMLHPWSTPSGLGNSDEWYLGLTPSDQIRVAVVFVAPGYLCDE